MGRYFEEFKVGDVFITPDRVIGQADIQAFANLTGDHNPVHVDAAFAAESVFGSCIAHGPMLIGITFGLISKLDLLDGTIIALKAITWSFDGPVRAGDRVHVRAEVKEARSSTKHGDRGTVTFAIRVVNQASMVVQQGTATGIIKTRTGLRKVS